jgi:hypothetical protein
VVQGPPGDLVLAGPPHTVAVTQLAEDPVQHADPGRVVLGDTPVILRGLFDEVISINRAGAFLYADFNRMPARERYGVRWMLLEPRARELYGRGWEDAAREMIGLLRLDMGRVPGEPRRPSSAVKTQAGITSGP